MTDEVWSAQVYRLSALVGSTLVPTRTDKLDYKKVLNAHSLSYNSINLSPRGASLARAS